MYAVIRVMLSNRWKQFDVITETIFAIDRNKYVRRNFVAMLTGLKKRRGLLEQIGKLKSELKSLSQSEESLAVKRSVEHLGGDQEACLKNSENIINNRKRTGNIATSLNTGRPWNHEAFRRECLRDWKAL